MEKGSVRTAIGHGLVAPKPKANALQRGVVPFEALPPCVRKGIWLIFQNGDIRWEIVRQRKETATRLDGNREESSFLFNEFSLHPENPLRREWRQALGKAATFLRPFGHLITPLENRRVKL